MVEQHREAHHTSDACWLAVARQLSRRSDQRPTLSDCRFHHSIELSRKACPNSEVRQVDKQNDSRTDPLPISGQGAKLSSAARHARRSPNFSTASLMARLLAPSRRHRTSRSRLHLPQSSHHLGCSDTRFFKQDNPTCRSIWQWLQQHGARDPSSTSSCRR